MGPVWFFINWAHSSLGSISSCLYSLLLTNHLVLPVLTRVSILYLTKSRTSTASQVRPGKQVFAWFCFCGFIPFRNFISFPISVRNSIWDAKEKFRLYINNVSIRTLNHIDIRQVIWLVLLNKMQARCELVNVSRYP